MGTQQRPVNWMRKSRVSTSRAYLILRESITPSTHTRPMIEEEPHEDWCLVGSKKDVGSRNGKRCPYWQSLHSIATKRWIVRFSNFQYKEMSDRTSPICPFVEYHGVRVLWGNCSLENGTDSMHVQVTFTDLDNNSPVGVLLVFSANSRVMQRTSRWTCNGRRHERSRGSLY